MGQIKVGHIVRIVNDYEPWNGTVARVKSIRTGSESPYELEIIEPLPTSSRQVGEDIGGWPEENIEPVVDRTAQEEAIHKYFPRRLDTLWSDATGNAVVHTVQNKFVRVLKDGTVDLPEAELKKLTKNA